MKRVLFILTAFFVSLTLHAEHITGGEMYYTLTGMSGNDYRYHVTLKLFRNCGPNGADFDVNAAIGIFNKSNNTLHSNTLVPLSGPKRTLLLSDPGPCITSAPTVCYELAFYEFDVTLPGSPAGYTIAYQRCCRINGINNLVGSGNTGATFTADIPGTSILANAPTNNSAKFLGIDTVIVCGGYPFTYNFSAVDTDPGDQLRYSFCNAYLGGNSGSQGGSQPNPPGAPPYSPVTYNSPYSASAPLGGTVSINPITGLITGTSPPQGIYVVTVCVQEIRQGVVIATQRKDLQIKAGGCDIAKAQLLTDYIYCDDLDVAFSNLTSSPLINSYYWSFGDPGSGINNSSTNPAPTHTFSNPGDYTIKLVTNRNQECSDSTTALVKVWPGFFPAFTTEGICRINPVIFKDATIATHGVVDSWNWTFGEGGNGSTLKNPTFKYLTTGEKIIQLTVTSSKGCSGTVTDTLTIIDKPPITLAFRDTLICVPDILQLQASGTGNFSWTPLSNIVNPNTGTPTVNPTTTTTYHVRLDEQGCINTDSVRVRVVTFVTLNAMPDTVICRTDAAQLRVISDGLKFTWTPTSSPASSLNTPSVQNPIATSGITDTYTVLAEIGSCREQTSINVLSIPYPVANAGPDTIICYNTPAYLHGSHDGSSFTWNPVNTLLNPLTLNPTAYPGRTLEYVLTSNDTKGCPKPGRDTVRVVMLPKINPYAGNDTLVVVGQPLQFNAEGGVSYIWSPGTGLNSTTIKNPIGQYNSEVDTIHYQVEVFNEAGCSDTAYINVTVFKTGPYVFVPTAFTPNGDGLNDLIRPIAVGVKKINFFRIFNRWGQLVFTTTTNGHGWDGRIGGSPQGSNVYVWMVGAIDYLGKPITLKGTVTLIR